MTDHTATVKAIYAAFAVGDIPSVLGALSPDIRWTEAEAALAITEMSSSSATSPDGTWFPLLRIVQLEPRACPSGSRAARLAIARQSCKGPRFAWEPPVRLIEESRRGPAHAVQTSQRSAWK